MVRPCLGPSSSMKKTDCQVPRSNLPSLMGRHSLDERRNDFRWDFALSSILSCWYVNLSVMRLFKVNSKSFKSPDSFSLTTMADVECLEKMEIIPLSTSISSLIFDVMSMISKFLFVFNFMAWFSIFFNSTLF